MRHGHRARTKKEMCLTFTINRLLELFRYKAAHVEKKGARDRNAWSVGGYTITICTIPSPDSFGMGQLCVCTFVIIKDLKLFFTIPVFF